MSKDPGHKAEPELIRGEVIREAGQVRERMASSPPTTNRRVLYDPDEHELRARIRREASEETVGGWSTAALPDESCHGECARTPGSTRGGGRWGDGRIKVGAVLCNANGDPLTEHVQPGDDGVYTRPCRDCNPGRYRAWVLGRMADHKYRDPELNRAQREKAAEVLRLDAEGRYR